MAAEVKKEIQLEIAHVLFTDIVGYSKLPIHQQRAFVERLNEIVRGTDEFQAAEKAGRLITIPTGDGITLVFYHSPEDPVECALEISRSLRKYPELRLRMGIHSGPVSGVIDATGKANVAGAGINMAQRVMDCGDAGHILLSKHVAEDLEEYPHWQPHLHELGECEVKHGVRVSLINLYTRDLGNPQLPEKLKQAQLEQAARAAATRPPPTLRRKHVLIAAGALLIIVSALGVWIYSRQASIISAAVEKSIAVLPFENFSDEKENAFFADGIQDDILTSLAQIQGLRVISRSSVMGFRASSGVRNLRAISKALGVANVLEGSVRREANRVVVNVQLIDALRDRHLWANRYDRTLNDTLGLQGELAGEIADALRVTLSPAEKARFQKKPTSDTEAYLIYLQANQIQRNPDTLLEDFKKAEQLYLQVITLDSQFALAHARLASTQAQIFHFYEPLDTWKSKARAEATKALQLQPDLAEAHLALAQCAYWIDQDYAQAIRELATASHFSPNNGDIGELMASIKRRQGHWQEALNAFEHSQKIDPQNPNIVRNLVFTNTALRNWPEASRWAAQMRAMAPTSLVAKIQSGYVDFWWKGDTRLLKSLLSQVPEGIDPDGAITSVRWEVAMLDRDFAGARKVLENSTATELSYTNEAMTPKSFLNGCIDLAQGDNVAAQKSFEMARPIFEKAVEEAPENAARHANLGWFYAFSGRKEDAIREGRRAVELKPESKDAFDGAGMSSYLALIYARVGEKDLAFPLIERLLNTPGAVDSVDYSITINDLKYRWEWDPIRSDPRFQKLLAAPESPKSADK
jgi:TolB-like protein/class 3 adenylate cyclase/Flp pilus assembly protein TadD